MNNKKNKRINALLKKANEHGCDGFLLSDSNNMLYFSGYSGEGFIIVTDNANVILTDGRYTEQAAQQAPDFDIARYDRSNFDSVLEHTALTYKIKSLCFESDNLTCSMFDDIKSALRGVSFEATASVGKIIRMIKDDAEIGIILNAAKITDKLINDAYELTKIDMMETELEAELLYLMGKKYNAQSAFDMIVAAGEHGSMPHAVSGSRRFKDKEMITLDFGAALNGYKSDMTRTYGIGDISKKMREIYKIVYDAQSLAQEALAPGKCCKDMDKTARDYITKYGYGEYFDHGLGHGVGLDVHEYPNLNKMSDFILKKNMVVTVEPGIYLPGVGGVRIENTCIITDDANKSVFNSPTELVLL